MEGLVELHNTINRVKVSFNPDLDIEGILFTMCVERYKITGQIISEVKKHFAKEVFETTIPRNVALSEAPSFGEPAIYYDKKAKGSKAYENLAKEIAKKYKALIYGILGNHDYDGQLEEMDIPNFEGKMIEFNGVTFTGMHGSFKYKNSDAPMLTNEESIELAKILPTCDIFLTHDKARTNNEENSHSGLEGITQYILDKKPEYHIHGHLHENMNENIGGISSLGFCRYAYIEVSKNGLKIKKIF